MEGFFGRLKNEFFHHRDWSGVTIPEFCQMLDAYLRYYNEERPKEKLGWLSPMQYRRSLGLAALPGHRNVRGPLPPSPPQSYREQARTTSCLSGTESFGRLTAIGRKGRRI